MKEGCITERGTHEELMNLNGDYATIFNNLLLGETPPVEINSKKEASGSQKSQDKGPKPGSVKKEKAVKSEEGKDIFERVVISGIMWRECFPPLCLRF